MGGELCNKWGFIFKVMVCHFVTEKGLIFPSKKTVE
jgi:hypothetical protein